jgi:hypothetical protein
LPKLNLKWNNENKKIETIPNIDEEFIPFDNVLVKNNRESKWKIDIFSNYDGSFDYPYICVGGSWKNCILYKGNECLNGTINNIYRILPVKNTDGSFRLESPEEYSIV